MTLTRRQPATTSGSTARCRPRAGAMRGLTLMELVLTMVILAVIAAVLAPVVSTGTLALVQGREAAATEAEATLALERFVRDVRRAGSVEGAAQGEPVDSLTLVFADGEVTYRLADGHLSRNERVLARRVATDAGETFFRVDRIPDDDGKQHTTLSLRIADSSQAYQATGVLR